MSVSNVNMKRDLHPNYFTLLFAAGIPNICSEVFLINFPQAALRVDFVIFWFAADGEGTANVLGAAGGFGEELRLTSDSNGDLSPEMGSAEVRTWRISEIMGEHSPFLLPWI